MNELIVVTGGTGYIGSHTSVELMEAGYEVLIIDNLVNSGIEVLDGIEKITRRKPTGRGWSIVSVNIPGSAPFFTLQRTRRCPNRSRNP